MSVQASRDRVRSRAGPQSHVPRHNFALESRAKGTSQNDHDISRILPTNDRTFKLDEAMGTRNASPTTPQAPKSKGIKDVRDISSAAHLASTTGSGDPSSTGAKQGEQRDKGGLSSPRGGDAKGQERAVSFRVGGQAEGRKGSEDEESGTTTEEDVDGGVWGRLSNGELRSCSTCSRHAASGKGFDRDRILQEEVVVTSRTKMRRKSRLRSRVQAERLRHSSRS